jgi:hypothetical protein
MFILTESGRLQNLSLLQDVKVTSTTKGELTKFHVGYVQINGEIINDGEYATMEEAQLKVDNVIANLLA